MTWSGVCFRHGFRLQHVVLWLSCLLLWHAEIHILTVGWCVPPPKTRWRKSCLSRPALNNDAELELVNLRKRELLEILKGYDVATDGLTKLQLIEAINGLRAAPHPVDAVDPEELQMSQRRVAEIAMEEWQNATTVGFDCKAGRRAEDGVDFDIIGPDGKLQHTVSFRHTWPPTCTCAAAQSWGSQKRCKHVCMILVKCGVPYASVADANWSPDAAEALLEDGASVESDPVARDYAEGMNHLSGSEAAQVAESWPRTGCTAAAAEAPHVVVESHQAMVVLKPAGAAAGVKSFSRGFLHRLDVPTSGLILVAKTLASFYDLRLQTTKLSATDPGLRVTTCAQQSTGGPMVVAAAAPLDGVRSSIHHQLPPWPVAAAWAVSARRGAELALHSDRYRQKASDPSAFGTHWAPSDVVRYVVELEFLTLSGVRWEILYNSNLSARLELVSKKFLAPFQLAVSELRRPFDKAAEVLGKINRLRAEREQRDKDFEILQEIMGPPSSPVAPPPPDLRHRARKIPVMTFGYRNLAPGELCYFAAIGDVTTAQYLLDQAQRCGDVFFVNSTDQRSRTALHFAAHEGSVEMVQTLLEAGADSTLRDIQDRTALHVASSRGQADVARLLVGSCIYRLRTATWQRFQQLRLQPPEPWEDPDMPIQRAARDALVEYLRALEALRRSFLLAEDKHQFTCLHYAIRDAYAGCFPILRMLLTSCFEFPEGREQDEIMRSKRFQLQPGPDLVAGLCNYMQQSEAKACICPCKQSNKYWITAIHFDFQYFAEWIYH
eukprot:s1334_g7.t1